MDQLRRRFYLTAIGVAAVATLALPGQRHVLQPLFFGIVGLTLARRNKARRRPAAARRSDRGRWLDAPIAEVDKSPCGVLLANRWRRDPSLRVIAGRGETSSTPGPHGGLWDREIDG